MLEYQTKFPVNLIDQEELEELVLSLAKMTGAGLESETLFVISTDDAEFSSVLDTLADGIVRKGMPKTKLEDKVRKTPKYKREIQPKANAGKNWRSLPRSWTNEKTKEVLSARELKRRQAAGTLDEGMTFVNFKGVRLVVLDGKLIKEPQA